MSRLEQKIELTERLVRKYFRKKPTCTGAIGILTPDGETVRGFGQPEGFDYANAMFEIGSITKVFTASLLSVMADQGRVRLTDSVGRYLPEAAGNPYASAITLEQLATHTSGLPRLPDNLRATITNPDNPYENYGETHLIEYLCRVSAPKKNRTSMEYSNLGAGLLGHLLARSEGKSYEETVREEILQPLSLGSTGISLSEEQIARFLPVYSFHGKLRKPWDLGVLEGAGALRSTATDLMKFLRSVMGKDSAPPAAPLRACLAPRHEVTKDLKVGLGWMVQSKKGGGTVYWHNGGTYGSTSFFGFDPDRGTGVVILTNNGTSPLTMILSSLGLAKMPVDHLGYSLLAD